jgi:hypothetical protein
MRGFVSIMLADGAPACVTERGAIRPGGSLTVPLAMAADLIGRDPDGWTVPDPAELDEVTDELTRRAAPVTEE